MRLSPYLKLLHLLLFICLLHTSALAQLKICSWNLKNFGKTKTAEHLSIIVQTIKEYDIIALQEINTAPDGAQRIASLVAQLNATTAFQWEYSISPPTTSIIPNEKERYVYIWKKIKNLQSSKAYLDTLWAEQIVREPYIKTFTYHKKAITLINFHAVPKKKNPSQEIAHFKKYPQRLNGPFIILGDFNTAPQNQVWNPLRKMNFELAISSKTTMKQKCIASDCLLNSFDNFVYPKDKVILKDAGTILFYEKHQLELAKARKISDHLPIFIEIVL